MCQFKAGDIVKRIRYDNGYLSRVGQKAVVLADSMGGMVHVTYSGVADEVWNVEFAELVQRKPEVLTPVNAYVFKVGDKGQTNAGWGYEIVAEHKDRLVVVGSGENTVYMVDKYGRGKGCPVVLVAPKRILYGMEAVFNSSLPNTVKNQETRITLYNSAEHRKQDIAGMTGQGMWTIVRQWEEEEA